MGLINLRSFKWVFYLMPAEKRVKRDFNLKLLFCTFFLVLPFQPVQGFCRNRAIFRAMKTICNVKFGPSLRHAIYFVGVSSKYKDTYSLCRLVSDAPETFFRNAYLPVFGS